MGRKSLSGKIECSTSQEELEFWTVQCLKEQCELWNLNVSGSKDDIISQMIQHLQGSGATFSRKILKQRSLSSSGSKTDLISRLESTESSQEPEAEEPTDDDNKENTKPVSPNAPIPVIESSSHSSTTLCSSSPQDTTETSEDTTSSPRNIREFLLQKKKKKQRTRRRSIVYGQKKSPAKHTVVESPSESSPEKATSSPKLPPSDSSSSVSSFPSPSILKKSRTPSPRNTTSPCTSPQSPQDNNTRRSPTSTKPASPQGRTPSPKSSPKQDARRSPRHSVSSYNSPPSTPRRDGTPRKSILKSPMTPRTKANIQWKAVEVREYERCHGGSLGIPDKGAFPLGLDWEVSYVHRKSVNDYEKWRIQQRSMIGCNLYRIPEQQRKKILLQWESEEALQDPDQKKDCTEIRQSRKHIGCMCGVGKSGEACDSRKCICVKNGIECHEDTCACTNDCCKNPSRHSFDENRVETFVQTRIRTLNAKGKYFLESDEEVLVTNK